MNKDLKKLIVLVLVITSLFSMVMLTYADSIKTSDLPANFVAPQKQVKFISSYATVSSVKNEDGQKKIGIQKTEEAGMEFILNITDKTVFVDNESGIAANFDTVKVGDKVFVYHSIIISKSNPPQAPAILILTNIDKSKSPAKMMDVETIIKNVDGSKKIYSEDGKYILTIPKDMTIFSFRPEVSASMNIKPGSRILAWYEISTMSFPMMAGADRVMLLPDDIYPNEVNPVNINTFDKIAVKNNPINLGEKKIVIKDDNVLVPLRIVSEALGYKVCWDEKNQMAILDDGNIKSNVKIGLDSYCRESSNAIGVGEPVMLGVAPSLINDSTYVPAKFFNILIGDFNAVTVNDGILYISIKYYIAT